MAVTTGTVKVQVEMTGRGDAAKKVEETKKSVEGLNAKIGQMKESVKPINQAREGFENLRGNALFLVGAVVSVGAAVGALSDRFSSNAQAIKAWGEEQKNVQAYLGTTKGLVEEIDQLLGKKPPDAFEKSAEAVLVQWAKNQEAINKATDAVKAYEEQIEDGKRVLGEWAPAVQTAMKELARTQTEINELTAEQGRLLEANARRYDAQIKAAEALMATLSLVDPYAETITVTAPKSKPTRGGASVDRAAEADAAFRREVARQRDAADAVRGGSGGNAEQATGGRVDRGGSSVDNGMRGMAADVRDFTAALSESLPGMEAFTGALSQISSLWGEYAESGKGAARATIMSVGAIARAGAEQIKNERLKAGVLAVIELGLGTALMFVPGREAEAAGHFGAAAILGSVAIFGGGGGGSSRGSSGRQRGVAAPLSERTESGGVVVNIYGGWYGTASPQETGAQLSSIARRGAGSGWT